MRGFFLKKFIWWLMDFYIAMRHTNLLKNKTSSLLLSEDDDITRV
jgi:hypothetical protein